MCDSYRSLRKLLDLDSIRNGFISQRPSCSFFFLRDGLGVPHLRVRLIGAIPLSSLRWSLRTWGVVPFTTHYCRHTLKATLLALLKRTISPRNVPHTKQLLKKQYYVSR